MAVISSFCDMFGLSQQKIFMGQGVIGKQGDMVGIDPFYGFAVDVGHAVAVQQYPFAFQPQHFNGITGLNRVFQENGNVLAANHIDDMAHKVVGIGCMTVLVVVNGVGTGFLFQIAGGVIAMAHCVQFIVQGGKIWYLIRKYKVPSA